MDLLSGGLIYKVEENGNTMYNFTSLESQRRRRRDDDNNFTIGRIILYIYIFFSLSVFGRDRVARRRVATTAAAAAVNWLRGLSFDRSNYEGRVIPYTLYILRD